MHNTKDSLRLFIALPVPAEIKERLSAQIQQLQQTTLFRRWTHPEDYHITLKFLGDTNPKDVEKIVEQLSRTLRHSAPLSLSLQGFGVFGPPAKPSVLWAKIGGDKQPLADIYESVEEAMLKQGWPRESRAYHPHVTIARQYNGPSPFAHPEWPFASHDSFTWTVDQLVLYRSHLNHKPMYEPLETLPFL